MPVLWTQSDSASRWLPVPLAGEAAPLPGAAARATTILQDHHPIVAMPVGAGAERVLLAACGASASVNGDPLLLGIRVLRDRDVIRSGEQGSIVYSTESLAQIAMFDGPHPIPCARCKTDIALGTPAVKCPKCNAWHHQGEDACWTYSATCANCDQPTALDGQYHWTPEAL